MSDEPAILFQKDGPIARVTLNKPDRLNALGPEQWARLAEIVESCRTDGAVRVLVLSGAGRAFCAGGDIKTAGRRVGQPAPGRLPELVQWGRLARALRELPQPTLASIGGPCFGAGVSLALACDLRICSEGATFGAAFSKIGFAIDVAGSSLLPQAVGLPRALEFHLLAEPLGAAQARQWGLVSRVVPEAELAAETGRIAGQLAAGAPLSHAFIKRQLYRGGELPLDAQIEYEAALQAMILTSEDASEGARARNEKRPPRFKGK